MSWVPTTDDKQKFLDASYAVYSREVPDDLSLLLTPLGTPLISENDNDGFFAEAFKDNDKIIIAYEGTSNNTAAYKTATSAADNAILNGGSPAAFADAVAFYDLVETADSTDPIYVTGHSLGGAEAEYVASTKADVAGGITFGAPGLPHYFGGSTNANAATFINYIDWGDPVGNYASDPDSVLSLAASIKGNGYHYGTVSHIGNLADAGLDLTYLALYELDVFNAVGLISHELDPRYYSDLGLTPTTLHAPLPDLQIDNLTPLNTTVTPGQSISVGAVIDNYGYVASGSFSTRIFLSPHSTLDANAISLATFDGTTYDPFGLGPNSVLGLNKSAIIPSYLAPGTYYLIVVADYLNQFADLNHDNNSFSVPIIIGSTAPQPTFTIVSSPSVGENQRQIVFTIVEHGSSSQPITLWLSTFQNYNGSGVYNTSIPGSHISADYYYHGLLPQAVTFSAGSPSGSTISQAIAINPVGLTTGSETFGFQVEEEDTNGNLVTKASTGFTIVNTPVDTSGPTLTGVTSSPLSGLSLGPGQIVTLNVRFNAPVIVGIAGGLPTLSLNDDETATYATGTGTNELSFTYTVENNDHIADLQVTGLTVPGGSSITDLSGNAAITSNVSADTGLRINTAIPTVLITSAGGAVGSPAQTIEGTADLGSVGGTVSVLDGTTLIGTAVVQPSGAWATSVNLIYTGENQIFAQLANASGATGISNPIFYDLGSASYILSPLTPTVTENQGTLAFTLTRSGDMSDATVFVQTDDTHGTANPGNKYFNENDLIPIHFAQNAAASTFSITINDIHATSGSQTFGLSIYPSLSAAGTPLAGTIFTIDDTDTNTGPLTGNVTTDDTITGTTTIGSQVNIFNNATLQNNGALDIVPGGALDGDNAGGALYNTLGNTINISTNDAPGALAIDLTHINNQGTIIVSPGSGNTATIWTTNGGITDTGAIEVLSGTLQLHMFGANSTANINASNLSVTADAALLLTGAGTFTISGGTYDIAGTTQVGNSTFTGSLIFGSGTDVNVGSNWIIDGSIDFSAANLFGTFQSLTLADSAGTLRFGAANITISNLSSFIVTIVDSGTITLTGNTITSAIWTGGGTIINRGTISPPQNFQDQDVQTGETFINYGISSNAHFESGSVADNQGSGVMSLFVASGGGAVINNSGLLNFLGSGTETLEMNSTLNNTGMVNISSAVGATLSGGGSSSASGFAVGTGITLFISGTAGADTYTFTGGTLGAGKLWIVSGAALKISASTQLDVAAHNDGTIEVAAGTLGLSQALTGTGSIVMDPDTVLALSAAENFANKIMGFGVGDAIDLVDIVATDAEVNANNQLIVSDAGVSIASIQLVGSYSGSGLQFLLGSDGDGGTSITLGTPAPPSLSAGGNAIFSETRTPTPVLADPSVAIIGNNNHSLTTATVAITDGTFGGDGDVLAATTAGTAIAASYNPTSEILTLFGDDTLDHYQSVLQSVTFSSTNLNATNSGTNLGRVLTWQLDDGATSNNLSAPATSTVQISEPTPPTAPTGLMLSPTSDSGVQGDGITNDTTPIIIGSGDLGDTVTLYDGEVSIGTDVVAADGTWSVQTGATFLHIEALSGDGTQILAATETDAFGNVSAPSSALSLTIDTIPPAITETLVADTGISTTDQITSDPAVTGSDDPNTTVTITEGSITLGTTTANGSGIWTFTPAVLSDGTYTIAASETDAAGNTGTTSLSFTLKTSAPAPSGLTLAPASDSGAKGDDITSDTAPVITGFGEAGDTITFLDGLTAVGTGTVGSDGSWAATTSALESGHHSLTATENDIAGNVSPTSAALSLVIDSVAPTVAITSLAGPTNNVAQTITGTVDIADAGTTVTVFDGTVSLGTASVADDGTWSLGVALSGNGVHTITAADTDAAGNTGVSSAVDYDLDTTPPTTTEATLTVAGNSAATPIGIAAPTDPNYDASALVVTLTELPTNGSVLLSDGAAPTPVHQGEILAVSQLASLEFQPALDAFGESGTLTYTVADPAGNSATGTASLVIQAQSSPPPPPKVNVQNITVAENTPVAASSMITSVSNPSGDSITAYEFIDEGGGSGSFSLNGVAQPANQRIEVLTNNLSDIEYVGGATPGTDTLEVGVYDYTTNSYSSYSRLTATTTAPPSATSPWTFTASQGTPVNVFVTPDGSNLATPVDGDFNLEEVTAPSGTNYTLPTGYQGVALVSDDAVTLLHGNYGVVDSNSNGGDTIYGGDGDDTINALVGDDIIGVGSGNATVFAGLGDVIDDPSGNVYFTQSGGANPTIFVISGGALMYAGADDTLVGGGGTATVVGAPGDVFTLGAGDDTVNVIPTGESLTFGSGSAIVYGGPGDTIGDGAGTVVDFTSGSNAIVLAGSGNSVLLYSGPGDTITGGNAASTVIGSVNDAILLGAGADTVNAFPANEVVELGSGANETIYGGAGDTIETAGGTAMLTFVAGSEGIVFAETAGQVQLYSGPSDTLAIGAGTLNIIGSANNVLTLGSGTDTVNALPPNESVTLGSGNATVFGGDGDTIGTSGGTAVVLTGGNNAIVVEDVGDAITVNDGAGDTITAGNVAATINGADNSVIVLGAANDTVAGSNGDTMTTGAGADAIDFGASHTAAEFLAPGAGVNTNAHDTISNFNQATGDRIHESGTAETNTIASAQSSGGNTTITLSDGSTVTLLGIAAIDGNFFS